MISLEPFFNSRFFTADLWRRETVNLVGGQLMTSQPVESDSTKMLKIAGLVLLASVALCGICGSGLFLVLLAFGGRGQ